MIVLRSQIFIEPLYFGHILNFICRKNRNLTCKRIKQLCHLLNFGLFFFLRHDVSIRRIVPVKMVITRRGMDTIIQQIELNQLFNGTYTCLLYTSRCV